MPPLTQEFSNHYFFLPSFFPFFPFLFWEISWNFSPQTIEFLRSTLYCLFAKSTSLQNPVNISVLYNLLAFCNTNYSIVYVFFCSFLCFFPICFDLSFTSGLSSNFLIFRCFFYMTLYVNIYKCSHGLLIFSEKNPSIV